MFSDVRQSPIVAPGALEPDVTEGGVGSPEGAPSGPRLAWRCSLAPVRPAGTRGPHDRGP